MKKQLLLAGLSLVLSTATFAQKNNITDAALRINKFSISNKLESQKKIAEEAKSYIDLAANHPDTKEDLKMYFYKSKIYFALDILDFRMKIKLDSSLTNCLKLQYFDEFKTCFNSFSNNPKVLENPEKSDIPILKLFVLTQIQELYKFAVDDFNEKNFLSAAQEFYICSEYLNFLGLDQSTLDDSNTNFNVSVNAYFSELERINPSKSHKINFQIARNVASCYQILELKINLVDLGLDYFDEVQSEIDKLEYKIKTSAPNVESTRLLDSLSFIRSEITNICLNTLDDAIKLDSLNKQFYYLKSFLSFLNADYNNAILHGEKAIQLDPLYKETIYVVALSKYNQGVILYNEAQTIDYKSPKFAEVENKSKEKFYSSIVDFEKYYQIDNQNKNVIESLWKANRKIGDIEKSDFWKKKLDELK
jgi:hypothetical protein